MKVVLWNTPPPPPPPHILINIKRVKWYCFIVKFIHLSRDNTKDKQPQDVSGVFEQPLKPIFKKIPDDIEVREGNMVRFDTVITGRPAPELAWYCNERKVYPDDHHKVKGKIVRVKVIRIIP